MENASKALLIAAAVLIVILLVAFGVNIFNQSKRAGDAEGTATEIQQGITQANTTINSAISNALTGLGN